MITVGMNYNVLPGKEEAFEKAFASVIGVMEAGEGHDKSALYKDVNNAQSYLIVSEWNSEEAYQAFISSDKFKGVVNWGKENILAGRPSHKIYKS